MQAKALGLRPGSRNKPDVVQMIEDYQRTKDLHAARDHSQARTLEQSDSDDEAAQLKVAESRKDRNTFPRLMNLLMEDAREKDFRESEHSATRARLDAKLQNAFWNDVSTDFQDSSYDTGEYNSVQVHSFDSR